MKDFDDLTPTELETVPDEQVERFIDIACAQQGVPLLPDYPQEPVKPDVKPIIDVFDVAGILVTSLEDAQAICDTLKEVARVGYTYVSGPGYEKRTTTPDQLNITQQHMYSGEYWDQVRVKMEAYAAAEQQYRHDKTEYEKAGTERDRVAESITMAVGTARARADRRAFLQRSYDRYLDLADGDLKVAARFLADANPEARELLPSLFDVPPEPRSTTEAKRE
jgi:hypothetical protein